MNRAVLWGLLAALLWGGWVAAEMRLVKLVGAYSAARLIAVGCALLALVEVPLLGALARRAGESPSWTRAGVGWAALTILLASVATVPNLLGMQQDAPISVALAATYPLVALLLAVGLGGETVGRAQLLGVVLIVAGAALIAGSATRR